ncbi:MAG: complex I subunit 1 family protein [Candidatus Omnitrophota bacterium]|jgi:NADH-quinone oxidoreductase subunit H
MNPLEYIAYFLVFPGFLFSSVMGLLALWVDRKVTARVQWRMGPPWYQNFVDVIKLLLYKETLIPKGVSKVTFLGMPLLAATSTTLVSTIILMINGDPHKGFIGDMIVVVYLLMIPAVALMLGGFTSANSLASLGASREMKLMLSYELPFILSLVVPIIKSGYCIRLGDIIMHQASGGIIIGSVSGALAFIVMLLCIQAKLGLAPFDIPEAETEIISGPYIEYSGKALAIFKLSKAIATFIVPVFLITLFFGGIGSGIKNIVNAAGQYLLILVLTILIKNTNPRVRIDQAVRFFWRPVTAVAVLSVVLAYLGY